MTLDMDMMRDNMRTRGIHMIFLSLRTSALLASGVLWSSSVGLKERLKERLKHACLKRACLKRACLNCVPQR